MTYAYDLDGRQTTMTDATGTSSSTFDAAERLTQLITPQGTNKYTYDQWNRRTLLDQGGGNTTAYAYSANTNRLQSVTKLPENEVTQFNYSASGLLTSQAMPNGVVTSYGYDGLDRTNSVVHQSSLGAVLSAENYVYDVNGNLTAHSRESGHQWRNKRTRVAEYPDTSVFSKSPLLVACYQGLLLCA